MTSLAAFGVLFLVYWRLLALALGVFLAVTAIVYWWPSVSFMLTRAWYGMPLVGKSRRLSKNIELDENNWFQSELTLCNAFKRHVEKSITDPEMFDQAKSYLAKAHETGRKPTSVFGWALVIVLVFVESIGFTYVFAGRAVPGISEAGQIPFALGLSLMLSTGLILLTHFAGSEWHKRTLIQKARVMWLYDEPKEQRKNLISCGEARLDKDEEDDVDETGKKEKPYIQLIRRVKTNAYCTPGVPGWNIAMIVAVVVVAVLAFAVRYETFMQDRTCATLNGPQATVPSIFSGIQGLTSPQQSLPNVITRPQYDNEKRGVSQQCNADWKASVATYVFLALLFVIVQVIGWAMGNRTGFAGQESLAAWKRVRSFGNRKEYDNWQAREYERLSAISQRHLASLQARIAARVRAIGVNPAIEKATATAGSRTFKKFVEQDVGPSRADNDAFNPSQNPQQAPA